MKRVSRIAIIVVVMYLCGCAHLYHDSHLNAPIGAWARELYTLTGNSFHQTYPGPRLPARQVAWLKEKHEYNLGVTDAQTLIHSIDDVIVTDHGKTHLHEILPGNHKVRASLTAGHLFYISNYKDDSLSRKITYVKNYISSPPSGIYILEFDAEPGQMYEVHGGAFGADVDTIPTDGKGENFPITFRLWIYNTSKDFQVSCPNGNNMPSHGEEDPIKQIKGFKKWIMMDTLTPADMKKKKSKELTICP